MASTEVVVLLVLCALLVGCISSYFGGRVHQQRRTDDQRRDAFRDGFHRASTAFSTLSITATDRDGAGGR